jgi:hypothetical protein
MRFSIEFYIAFLGIVVVWIVWPLFIGAGWVPTPRKIVRRMLLLAEVGPDDTLYELGSGDGRILFMAAREFGSKAVGIEADPLRVLWTVVLIRLLSLKCHVNVLWGNFFKKDLRAASVVTVYQSKSINNKLRNKFIEELRPGTRVVSYAFTFDGWVPERVDEESQIYLYII